jgi:hypothetical protein
MKRKPEKAQDVYKRLAACFTDKMTGTGMDLDARITKVVLCLLFLFAAGNGYGQDSTELAKKTQNPVADMISVPVQSNFNFGVGPADGWTMGVRSAHEQHLVICR